MWFRISQKDNRFFVSVSFSFWLFSVKFWNGFPRGSQIRFLSSGFNKKKLWLAKARYFWNLWPDIFKIPDTQFPIWPPIEGENVASAGNFNLVKCGIWRHKWHLGQPRQMFCFEIRMGISPKSNRYSTKGRIWLSLFVVRFWSGFPRGSQIHFFAYQSDKKEW